MKLAHHLLRLAQVDVLPVPAPWLAILDVHDADERHGPAPHQQDGEEHDDDGGGADELPLLDGLEAEVEAQGVRDRPPQAWRNRDKDPHGEREIWEMFKTYFKYWFQRGFSPLNHMMNIILGVILWSRKKLSKKDRGKMFTARPRRTKTYRAKTQVRVFTDGTREKQTHLVNPVFVSSQEKNNVFVCFFKPFLEAEISLSSVTFHNLNVTINGYKCNVSFVNYKK